MNEARDSALVLKGISRAGIIVTKIGNCYLVYASVDHSRWPKEGTSSGIEAKRFLYNAMIKEASNITGQALTL